jgi:hypothetical protein
MLRVGSAEGVVVMVEPLAKQIGVSGLKPSIAAKRQTFQ